MLFGRFISADDISYLDPSSVGGLNLYAYCGCNPVMNFDPNGNSFIGVLIGSMIVGPLISGGLSLYNAIDSRASAGEVVLHTLGGAIKGAALGAAMTLGGAAGMASLGITITGYSLTTAAALSIAVTATSFAGLTKYTLDNIGPNDSWSLGEFTKEGIISGIEGAVTFGIGYLGGKAGLFANGFNQMDTFTFMKYIIDNFGKVSTLQSFGIMFQSMLLYSGAKVIMVSTPSAIVRWIIEKIF